MSSKNTNKINVPEARTAMVKLFFMMRTERQELEKFREERRSQKHLRNVSRLLKEQELLSIRAHCLK